MNTKDIMISQLTNYERDNEIINELYEVLGSEMDKFLHEIEDLYKQFNIDTATWGISEWEENMGIETNKGLSRKKRRADVKEKLRKTGKVNTKMLEDILQESHDGKVEVWFNGRLMFNIPLEGLSHHHFDTISNIINTTKPAHLGFEIDMYMNISDNRVKLGTQTIDAAVVEVLPFITRNINYSTQTLYGIGSYNNEDISVYPKHTYNIGTNNELFVFIFDKTGMEEVGVYPKK